MESELELEWVEIYAGPDGGKHFQSRIGWLTIDLWAPRHMDVYFYCKELGYNQYCTQQRDIELAKQIAETKIFERIKKVSDLSNWIELNR